MNEWVITHKEYAERSVIHYGDETYSPYPLPSYPNEYAYQYWNNTGLDPDYTSLFINLIDSYNELGNFFPNEGIYGSVNVQVAGYTLPQIESWLNNFFNLQSLALQLKANKPGGITDAQIDLLLNSY